MLPLPLYIVYCKSVDYEGHINMWKVFAHDTYLSILYQGFSVERFLTRPSVYHNLPSGFNGIPFCISSFSRLEWTLPPTTAPSPLPSPTCSPAPGPGSSSTTTPASCTAETHLKKCFPEKSFYQGKRAAARFTF